MKPITNPKRENIKKKDILTCCISCGKKYGDKEKGMLGVWKDDCDICGAKDVPCASAPHDFGIYSSEEIRIADKVQDLI